MSMISEQVKELRELADGYKMADRPLAANTIYQAADTIEALSAKLQAVNMEQPAEDCGGWISANVKNCNFICDNRLKDYYGVILIKYETMKKRRYVKPVLCNYGYVSKKIGGEITAWRPLPEPYHEH